MTGKYQRGQKPPEGTRFAQWGGGGAFVSEARFTIVEQLQAYGEQIGHSVLDIAIGWLAAQPYISSVSAGVTKPEQIRQNVAAAGWALTAENLEQISRIASSA